MKKIAILVPTDFSNNSKSGLRFAIQLASKHKKVDLTFFHSYHIMRPTSWSDEVFEAHEKKEATKIQNKLTSFVRDVYRKMNIVPGKTKCVIRSSVLVESNIMEYAESNNFNYICISTRGAGGLKKVFGTNTSNLINHSSVPVIAVPCGYRMNRIKNMLYASDLINLKNELMKVVAFAKQFKLKVELLHFIYPVEVTIDEKLLSEALRKISKYNIKLHLKNVTLERNLISNIETAVKKIKPSILVMFTQQNRSFFQKVFFSTKSSECSFNTKVPLLVYNKTQRNRKNKTNK